MQIFFKIFKTFQKSLMSTFLLNVPRTENLATSFQYRTWEEFMYEILSDVLPEQKFWSRYWCQLIKFDLFQLNKFDDRLPVIIFVLTFKNILPITTINWFYSWLLNSLRPTKFYGPADPNGCMFYNSFLFLFLYFKYYLYSVFLFVCFNSSWFAQELSIETY